MKREMDLCRLLSACLLCIGAGCADSNVQLADSATSKSDTAGTSAENVLDCSSIVFSPRGPRVPVKSDGVGIRGVECFVLLSGGNDGAVQLQFVLSDGAPSEAATFYVRRLLVGDSVVEIDTRVLVRGHAGTIIHIAEKESDAQASFKSLAEGLLRRRPSGNRGEAVRVAVECGVAVWK